MEDHYFILGIFSDGSLRDRTVMRLWSPRDRKYKSHAWTFRSRGLLTWSVSWVVGLLGGPHLLTYCMKGLVIIFTLWQKFCLNSEAIWLEIASDQTQISIITVYMVNLAILSKRKYIIVYPFEHLVSRLNYISSSNAENII